VSNKQAGGKRKKGLTKHRVRPRPEPSLGTTSITRSGGLHNQAGEREKEGPPDNPLGPNE